MSRVFHLPTATVTVGVDHADGRATLLMTADRGEHCVELAIAMPPAADAVPAGLEARWRDLVEQWLPRLDAQGVEAALNRAGAFTMLDALEQGAGQ